MKRQEIPYRMPDGSTNWLQPGSQAHQLHTEGKTKQLAEHMKDVQRRHDALIRSAPVPRNGRDTIRIIAINRGDAWATGQ